MLGTIVANTLAWTMILIAGRALFVYVYEDETKIYTKRENLFSGAISFILYIIAIAYIAGAL